MSAPPSGERGFSLVELLVAVSLSLAVFGIVATALVAYQNDAQRATRQSDSQDQARTAIDRVVRELRNVASSRIGPSLIERTGAYDLVFQTISTTAPAAGSGNAAGVARVRYCLPPDPSPGSAANQVMYAQTESWTGASVPPNPWTATSPCPSAPGSLPAGASISTTRLAEHVMNRRAGASRPAFAYDSTTLSQITTIDVDLFVDGNPDLPPGETELRGAAFLRNQNQAPVAAFTANATGNGHVLLNGGGSSDPDNQRLTLAWFKVAGGTRTPIGTAGLLDWAPGPGTYTVELQVTDTGGLTSTASQTVAVS